MHWDTVKPFGFFLIILVLITYGSLGEGDTKNFELFHFEHSDKLIHAIMYFSLTISLAYGMVKKTGVFKNWMVYLVVTAVPLSYGIFMEILQYLITATRHGEWADFAANLIGIGLAFFLSLVYYNLKKAL